jgi:hydrogenase expression/formation protein HypE
MTEEILLSHGEGGKRTRDLVRTLIVTRFGNPILAPLLDSGLLGPIEGEIAFTTDSYVVTPPVFPGGDIGRLAVCGTLNDLAVCGAKPVAISCSLILEEGYPVKNLVRILDSMRAAAQEGEVLVACGDTKVVERGKGDGIFITTSGVGALLPGWRPSPRAVSPGDRVILTGTMGDHQVSVLVARNLLEISAKVLSDVAPLSPMLLEILARFGADVRFMRDPTRGGVGVSLIEMAESSGRRIILEEALLPVSPAVRGVCEILGFDPLYLANEGKAILLVSPSASDAVVSALRCHSYGRGAAVVGEVADGPPGALLRTAVGGLRAVDYPVGDQLPRIC